MSAPTTVEARLLHRIEAALTERLGDAADDHAARLDALEAVACSVSGLSLDGYRETDDVERRMSASAAAEATAGLAEALHGTAIDPALALAALARPPMDRHARRSNGAYYTDWRLARFLAKHTFRPLQPGTDRVIDPASGTGALLVALLLEHCPDVSARTQAIAESVHAADLSPAALRGTKLALASLTPDADAVRALASRLRMHDSLAEGPGPWLDVAPTGFDLVIGNPPWERLKVTRHEHLAAAGDERHYGHDYTAFDDTALRRARDRVAAYVAEQRALYELAGSGEVDLYRLFLALAVNLAGDGGQIAYLVPAGLIRSQGAESLRRYLFDHTSDLRLCVLHNRARFFAIDTRFKFLAVHAVASHTTAEHTGDVLVSHADGTPDAVEVSDEVVIAKRTLRRLRPDLTVPEVRSRAEWRLFRTIAERARSEDESGSDGWSMRIFRELDMSNDRDSFSLAAGPDHLPLIEGRMVHQFRHAAKAYVSGTGRSARWDVLATGDGRLRPQYWVERARLRPTTATLVDQSRVGFCDIVGQTNERTMMAARIPAGVVCGNKVPTILFEDDQDQRRSDAWLAIANSFAFDWLLRRIVTTTVNFFVLRSVPLPSLDLSSEAVDRLLILVRRLGDAHLPSANGHKRKIPKLRAELDALVMRAYGFTASDVRLLFGDFPLLDRGQPTLPGEQRSTITADTVRLAFESLDSASPDPLLVERVRTASRLGARPYVAAEFASVEQDAMASMSAYVKKQPLDFLSTHCNAAAMSARLKRFVVREVLPGDLRKVRAESNDSATGGGARDLRFRPWQGHFEDVIARMASSVDQTRGRDRYWVGLHSLMVDGGEAVDNVAFWPPTNARPNEGRLANIDQIPAFADDRMPDADEGRAFYFVWQDDNGVYGAIISEESLRSGDWHPAVAEPILRDLRLARKTVRGYVDFETGRSAFSHELP